MNDIEFIETLKQKRNDCDYSKSQLAKELQISRQNLNEIENGKTKASKESGLLHFLLYQREYIVFRLSWQQRLHYIHQFSMSIKQHPLHQIKTIRIILQEPIYCM